MGIYEQKHTVDGTTFTADGTVTELRFYEGAATPAVETVAGSPNSELYIYFYSTAVVSGTTGKFDLQFDNDFAAAQIATAARVTAMETPKAAPAHNDCAATVGYSVAGAYDLKAIAVADAVVCVSIVTKAVGVAPHLNVLFF